MKNILVGIDFHENTSKLLKQAAIIAEPFQSKIWLVHVAAPDPDFVGYEAGPQSVRDNRADDLNNEHTKLQQMATELQNSGLNAEALLVQGATVETLVNEANKLQADMMIVGHHDYNFLQKLFKQEVSTDIIDEIKLPVLIVPLN